MPDAREVYQFHPEHYDELVRREDREGNLLKAIRSLVTLEGSSVVELGAGTGRVTALLAPYVRSIQAFDVAASMLEVGRRKLAKLGVRNCGLYVADNTELPLLADTADLTIAGWTYGHQTVWRKDNWRAPIEAAICEMTRVLRPGGTAIIIETLGTGHLEPFSPPNQLGRYYAMLTDEYRFEKTWIRTDYEFASMDEGERLLRLFFGEGTAELFVSRSSSILPECTGLWWHKK